MTPDRFDPAKDAINLAKHGVSLAFGDRIFEDESHMIMPSIREIDGEERFKVVGVVDGKLFTGSSSGEASCPASCRCEGATEMKNETIVLPADPNDPEDFDVTTQGLERAQRARIIRKTRTDLGLSQAEFAARFRVPVGTLRDWEQARVTAPDFAVAYVKVIGQHPDLVAQAVA